MKKLGKRQSRKHIKKPKAKVAGQHAKAGHWTAQAQPMFESGKIHYEVSGTTEAMSYGGIAPMHRLVTKLGLRSQIDADLSLLKMHLPYHESDQVLNIAYNILCGGTRLEDIEQLRHGVAYMNALGADLIPDPTTAGDLTQRFSEADVLMLVEAINAIRPTLWAGRGVERLWPIAYMGIDGTIASTYVQRKAGMDISHIKGIWGYAPLIISLANTKEVLYLVNRPDNMPNHQGDAAWIDNALMHLIPYAPHVCMRGNMDFSLTKHFDQWAVAGRLYLRHGQQGDVADLRRGPQRRPVEPTGAPTPIRHTDRQHA